LVSEAEEIQMGKEADADVRKTMGVYNDPALQKYVSDVGMRLARASHRPDLPWTFTVVDEPAVNAFALPGGFIYITRGILPYLRNESELAAVLGHEVGHVDARHGAAQMSKQQIAGLSLAIGSVLKPEYGDAFGVAGMSLGLVFLKFGREAELEADKLGTTYAAANNWDPGGMPGLLDTLGRIDSASASRRGIPGWALTHPPAADRVTKVQEAVVAARTATSTVTNKPALDQQLDGVVYGDSREKGVFRNGEFVHPILRFGLRFPQGWDVANSDDAVVAQPAGGGGGGIILQAVPGAQGSLISAAEASMSRAGLSPVEDRLSSRTINGLSAVIGRFDGVVEQTPVSALAGFVQLTARPDLYRIMGLASSATFSQMQAPADATIRSFRQLTQAEADAIQDARVTFYTVRDGDTWESIAAATGGRATASTIAIMNGATPTSAVPRPGARVRTVR
jgi:predicted Zn-dependent protease